MKRYGIKRFIFVFSALIVLQTIYSCRPAVPPLTVTLQVQDGKYDSEFPVKPTSNNLKKIVPTVKMVSSMTFYKIYGFPLDMSLTLKDIKSKKFDLEKKASYSAITQSPANGTATVIYSSGRSVILLTCAHIVNEPDTLVKNFVDLHGNSTFFIQSVSIKLRQSVFIPSLPRGNDVEILAMNTNIDLALLGIKLIEQPGLPIPYLNLVWGNSRELQWGNFVYVIGYPGGKKVISNALVSNPQPGEKFDFVLNTNLHRGVSGGIVLALRDGPPNFELVGIVNALSAKERYILRPDPSSPVTELVRTKPYKGDVYVASQMEQLSGTTYVIGVEKVKRFINANLQKIKEKGYFLPAFH